MPMKFSSVHFKSLSIDKLVDYNKIEIYFGKKNHSGSLHFHELQHYNISKENLTTLNLMTSFYNLKRDGINFLFH